MEEFYVTVALYKREFDRLDSLCERLGLCNRDVVATALRTLERELDEIDRDKKDWEERHRWREDYV